MGLHQRIKHWLNAEQGSNVTQAAAVALLATTLIAALLLGARSLNPEIQTSFRCLLGSLSGGGGACGGTAAIADQASAPPPAAQPAQQSSSPWQTFVSVGIDFIPIVGDAKGLWESFSGRDTITGEELSTAERILGLAGIVGLSELRLLARGDDVIGAVRALDRAGDAADAGNNGRRVVDGALEACGIGATPPGKGRGLAKPLAAGPCFNGRAGGYQTRADFDAGTNGYFETQAEADTAWQVYRELLDTNTTPVIGRQVDTAVAGEWAEYAILNNPNWTLRVNDAWIQGGIDRRARFYLGSPQNNATLKHPIYGETVFKRELDQLRRAGYRQEGDYMIPPVALPPAR